jgi:hypothetical protein
MKETKMMTQAEFLLAQFPMSICCSAADITTSSLGQNMFLSSLFSETIVTIVTIYLGM